MPSGVVRNLKDVVFSSENMVDFRWSCDSGRWLNRLVLHDLSVFLERIQQELRFLPEPIQ
jgi:hypothetical protein